MKNLIKAHFYNNITFGRLIASQMVGVNSPHDYQLYEGSSYANMFIGVVLWFEAAQFIQEAKLQPRCTIFIMAGNTLLLLHTLYLLSGKLLFSQRFSQCKCLQICNHGPSSVVENAFTPFAVQSHARSCQNAAQDQLSSHCFHLVQQVISQSALNMLRSWPSCFSLLHSFLTFSGLCHYLCSAWLCLSMS